MKFLSLIPLSFLFFLPLLHSLSTVSISHAPNSNQTLICALIHSSLQQSYLNCTSYPTGIVIPLNYNVSFSGIVGGNGFLCALGSTPSSSSFMVCWRFLANGTNLSYRRIYLGPSINDLDSGNSHICGIVNGTTNSNSNSLRCWQWREFNPIPSARTDHLASSLSVGEDFVCGLSELGRILCFGSNRFVVNNTPSGNYRTVSAGFNHACAISLNGSLDCWGMTAGMKPAGLFTSLALGENRSCGLRVDGTVTCWGDDKFDIPATLRGNSFEAIKANRDVFCGIATSNYSLFCWGNEILDSSSYVFENVVPGPCLNKCPCGVLPNYERYCGVGQIICEQCIPEEAGSPPVAPPPAPVGSSRRTDRSSHLSTRMVVFLVVGCVGSSSLLVMLLFFFVFRRCRARLRSSSRVHDSGPMDMPPANDQSQNPVKPVLQKKLSQLVSLGSGSHLEEFSLENLIWATNKFSDNQKIGFGSFGSVYRAILEDGREVAIKRAETSSSLSRRHHNVDKDHAFMNELEFLSRLNHKNLVRLLGFCEDGIERMLVYEYVENGSLHDHLHTLDVRNLRSWVERIKVALDSARGIEYLHVYAVPQIIHRDIKSSNILLDATWTAKVSDFGLSLICPQDEDCQDEDSHVPLCAAGTVGYMDPEYFRLQQLTTKSDVYSFGVVLLELLTGYKAIHNNEEGFPRNVVDFVVPYIERDEIYRVLDPKVPPPSPYEVEAIKQLGYLAMDCVMVEGYNRPSMTEIVMFLEKALSECVTTPTLSPSSTIFSA